MVMRFLFGYVFPAWCKLVFPYYDLSGNAVVAVVEVLKSRFGMFFVYQQSLMATPEKKGAIFAASMPEHLSKIRLDHRNSKMIW